MPTMLSRKELLAYLRGQFMTNKTECKLDSPNQSHRSCGSLDFCGFIRNIIEITVFGVFWNWHATLTAFISWLNFHSLPENDISITWSHYLLSFFLMCGGGRVHACKRQARPLIHSNMILSKIEHKICGNCEQRCNSVEICSHFKGNAAPSYFSRRYHLSLYGDCALSLA